MTHLLIDSNEKHLIDYLTNNEIEHNEASLYAGDIAILVTNPESKSHNVVALYERKTYADLLNSIKGGSKKGSNRYVSQKEKLFKFRAKNHECKIFYIIEGEPPTKPQDLKIVESSIFHMQFRDGFGIIYTKSVEDTALTLVKNQNSIVKLMSKGIKKHIIVSEEYDKLNFAKLELSTCVDLLLEKKSRDIESQVINMWGSFRGITHETAKKLAGKVLLIDCLLKSDGFIESIDLLLNEGTITKKQYNTLVGVASSWDPAKSLQTINGITKSDCDKLINYDEDIHVLDLIIDEDGIYKVLTDNKRNRIIDVLNYN